jgi:hypothetical protein
MKNLTNYLTIITMLLMIPACNDTTPNTDTETNTENTFYLWESIQSSTSSTPSGYALFNTNSNNNSAITNNSNANTATTDNVVGGYVNSEVITTPTTTPTRSTFVAGAGFDSFTEEQRKGFTSGDVVDHYGNQTYYYAKKQGSSYDKCEWIRGQLLPGNTVEEADRYRRENSISIEYESERAQLQLNEEDEWEPVPAENDGAPTN